MRINYSKSLSIATVENKLVISKQLIKKLTKYKEKKKKKKWNRQPTKHREKRYNLSSSTYQWATLPNCRYRYKQKEKILFYYKRICV